MTLGDIIAEYRAKHNMSMDKFAEISGISKGYVSMLERNSTQRGDEPAPSIDIYRKVSMAVNVTLDDLIRMVEGKIALSDTTAPNLDPIPQTVKRPRLGVIACGEPIITEENFVGYDDVPVFIKCDFTLRCEGDSMINARILDGDIVYIRQQPDVDSGEIAAVYVDGAMTLKRVYKYPGQLVLQPENPKYAPLVYTGSALENIRIIGKAVGFTSNHI